MKKIIKVEGLYKGYPLRLNEPYVSLREVITTCVKNIGKRFISPSTIKKSPTELFYALKNIDFEVEQGERLGIVGRNGAGKSSLLKVLSRITHPTKGKITTIGRLASLLEVGTGFHPELTGRENISLNGAILGMSKSEIRKKFDEIVDFAEVEKFLDLPVKKYSSGMYVRLAFSVAAHLESEILIVDEVLAVGDTAFQKKCLGKMQGISHHGKTVLFVSHNLSAVKSMCSRALLLDHGELIYQDETQKVIQHYLSKIRDEIEQSTPVIHFPKDIRKSGELLALPLQIIKANLHSTSMF